MNLNEVRKGLAEGKSYQCELDHPKGGWEYVRALGHGYFEHTVAGYDFGGVAELPIGIIDEERWTNVGWMEI